MREKKSLCDFIILNIKKLKVIKKKKKKRATLIERFYVMCL